MKTIIVTILSFSVLICHAQNDSIRFHYLGHSSFLIFFNNEVSALTDYGKPDAWADYGWSSPIHDIGNFQPTIVTYSHLHDDHYDSTRIPKNSKYIMKKADTLKLKNLSIYPIPTSEDDISTISNYSYLFKYKGIKVLHLGDCQANIMNVDSIDNRNYIKNNISVDLDVVLLAIEGKSKFIPQVEKFIRLVHPKVIIPMHYWSNEYKSNFFKHIEKQTVPNNFKYEILQCETSNYTYKLKEKCDTIYIINVDPNKFSKND